MKLFYLFLFTAIVKLSFGQAEKAYITKAGKFSDDPKKAVSYVIIEKLAGDSAYSAVQYDMRDTILFSGFFKDERLSVPNGKFIFYRKNKLQTGSRIINTSVDTNNYVNLTGYYVNGKREGRWTQYTSNGKIEGLYTFDNDKLNGPFTNFYNGNGDRSEGTMVNDVQEGKYLVYNAEGVLAAESNYYHGRDTSRILHIHPAMERETFSAFMEKSLKKYRRHLDTQTPVVRFVVDKTGKIVNPEIVKGINPEIDSAIISALSAAPSFIPAIYNDSPMEEKVEKKLWLFRDRGYSVSSHPSYNVYRAPRTITMVYYMYGGQIVGAGFPTH